MRYVHESNYLSITLGDDFLTIDLTDDGKKYALECINDDMGHYELFYELMEDSLCNGLTLVNGDQIDGWLTDCDVIGEDIHYGDSTFDVVLDGNIYTNISWYQVYSNYEYSTFWVPPSHR